MWCTVLLRVRFLWHYIWRVEWNAKHLPCPTFLRRSTASDFITRIENERWTNRITFGCIYYMHQFNRNWTKTFFILTVSVTKCSLGLICTEDQGIGITKIIDKCVPFFMLQTTPKMDAQWLSSVNSVRKIFAKQSTLTKEKSCLKVLYFASRCYMKTTKSHQQIYLMQVQLIDTLEHIFLPVVL